MRSIWFSLLGARVPEVEAELLRHGFVHPDGVGELRYPSAHDPTLYVKCEGYEWVERYGLQDEYAELLQAIGGREPTAHVGVDVSGRIPGDVEVRQLAAILLRKFDGFVFDGFLSYAHAWTLSEIEQETVYDGLKFFDYLGHWNLLQKSSGQGHV